MRADLEATEELIAVGWRVVSIAFRSDCELRAYVEKEEIRTVLGCLDI